MPAQALPCVKRKCTKSQTHRDQLTPPNWKWPFGQEPGVPERHVLLRIWWLTLPTENKLIHPEVHASNVIPVWTSRWTKPGCDLGRSDPSGCTRSRNTVQPCLSHLKSYFFPSWLLKICGLTTLVDQTRWWFCDNFFEKATAEFFKQLTCAWCCSVDRHRVPSGPLRISHAHSDVYLQCTHQQRLFTVVSISNRLSARSPSGAAASLVAPSPQHKSR